jgi:2-oxoglutarate ferredoxin oxidoreductase subunit delta
MSAKVTISVKHCKGCKLCLAACPRKALKLSGRHTDAGMEIIEWDASKGCSLCLLCTAVCPDAAITVEDTPDAATHGKH